jgi:hypothetical protein
MSAGALAKGGSQAGSLNRNIHASSGPSGDGPYNGAPNENIVCIFSPS